MTHRTVRYALPFAALLLVSACGGNDDAAEDAADASADTAEAATDAADASVDAAAAADDAADAAPALDVAAIDAVVAGIRKENEMLSSVAERMGDAKDDMAKLALMTEIQPAKLEEAGAGAAGLDAGEYRQLKDQLFTVVGQAAMRAMLEAQTAAQDFTGMDEATAAQARQAAEEMKAQFPQPYEGLDPATAEALQARQQELGELRAMHIGLLFKAAGG
jgi:hypothetical protein